MACSDVSAISQHTLRTVSVRQGKRRIRYNCNRVLSSRNRGLQRGVRSVTSATQDDRINSTRSGESRTRHPKVLRMERAGPKLSCLLELINQQAQLQHHFWNGCHKLKFPTTDGHASLHHLRACRLRSLLTLAHHFDERERSNSRLAAGSITLVRASQESASCITATSGAHQLRAELAKMSLQE